MVSRIDSTTERVDCDGVATRKRDIKNHRCWYCDNPLEDVRGEWDHFPTPYRNGGNSVVPACLDCTNLKDRTPLKQWPLDVALAAFNDLNREGKILVGKLLAQIGDLKFQRQVLIENATCRCQKKALKRKEVNVPFAGKKGEK